MKFNKKLILLTMREYGNSVGFPLSGMTPAEFIKAGHLQKMFNVLLKRNFVKREWYEPYKKAATIHYQHWYMRNRK